MNQKDKQKQPLPDHDTTTFKEAPFLYIKGFFMGSADVVPGVSGGTIALIFGIYYRFVNAIKSVDSKAIRSALKFRLSDVFDQVHWKFLLILLTGAFSAVLFFTRVIPLPELMHSHPELIYGLFFGLILGSVFLLIYDLKDFSGKIVLYIAIGTFVGYQVVTLVPTETPDNTFFIFFSGSIAISAMVLPGISGSFILLILRKYDTVLGSFGKLGGSETVDALMVLVPFGFGILFGLAVFARLLSWLLKRYYTPTLCILIGFMAGSLYIIWPFQEQVFVDSVRTEVVLLQSEEAMELADVGVKGDEREYRKLGVLVNPEAPLEEKKVEIITVKRKMVSSTPYMPDIEGTDPRLSNGRRAVIEGWSMMLVGLTLVFIVGYISIRKNGSITKT